MSIYDKLLSASIQDVNRCIDLSYVSLLSKDTNRLHWNTRYKRIDKMATCSSLERLNLYGDEYPWRQTGMKDTTSIKLGGKSSISPICRLPIKLSWCLCTKSSNWGFICDLRSSQLVFQFLTPSLRTGQAYHWTCNRDSTVLSIWSWMRGKIWGKNRLLSAPERRSTEIFCLPG